jgi:MFS transporter, DHA2 family, multidrug resistance protein
MPTRSGRPTIHRRWGRNGWAAPPLVAIVVGTAAGVAFSQRQRGLEHPLLDLTIFRVRPLRVALVLALLIALLMAGTSLTATLFMQMVKGISPLHVGLWLLAPSIAMVVMGNIAMELPAASARPTCSRQARCSRPPANWSSAW